MSPLRVLLSGATGLVGRALLPTLLDRGDTVRSLTRGEPTTAQPGNQFFQWDGLHAPASALPGLDAVVHLAGEPIFGGYPGFWRRDRMVASRVESTREIVSGIAALEPSERPRIFVCASAVGFYGDRGDELLDEASAPGEGFLSTLCRDWENAAEEARGLGLDVVRLRFGVIFSRNGGALPMMRRPFEWNLGGRLGSGRQWVPWVHIDDVIGAILLALDGELDGPVNVVAPNPVTNRELTHELATRLERPGFWVVPAFVLRAALGEIADELVGSKRVAPGALERARYRFVYPSFDGALSQALR